MEELRALDLDTEVFCLVNFRRILSGVVCTSKNKIKQIHSFLPLKTYCEESIQEGYLNQRDTETLFQLWTFWIHF